MTAYTSQLEDTVWCNDRSVYSTEDGPGVLITNFGAHGRLRVSPYIPSLECGSDYQMTVAATDVDKHLNYPIALLTADEMALAGSGLKSYSTSSYLNIGLDCFSLTPYKFDGGSAAMFMMSYGAFLSISSVGGSTIVRPSVSLKLNTTITGTGDGSVTTPYVVE